MASTASTSSLGGRGTARRNPPARPQLHYQSIATTSMTTTSSSDASAAGSITLISPSAPATRGTPRHRCHRDRSGDDDDEESTPILLPHSASHALPPLALSTSTSTSTLRLEKALTHATYHTVSSILGTSAVLALPSALAHLGWPWGLALFLLCTAVSYYTGICLIDLQSDSSTAVMTDECDGSSSSSSVDDDREGGQSRLVEVATTYSEVVDSVMGEGFADRFVRPFQFLVFVTVLIATLIMGGETMAMMDAATVPRPLSPSSGEGGDFEDYDDVRPLEAARTRPWIGASGAALFLLGLAPNLSSDASWGVSLVGTVAAVLFTIVMLVGSSLALSSEGSMGGVDYGRPVGETAADYAFGTLNSFGLMAFAYGGHSVLPDVQASIAASAQSCTYQTYRAAGTVMTRAFQIGYVVIFTCYLSVTCMGYAAFGSSVTPGYVLSDVAPYLGPGVSLFALALVVANAFAICTVYNQAAFVFLEDVLLPPHRHEFLRWVDDPMWRIKLATRMGYISTATIVAVAVPFFDSVAGLSGAIGFTPMTFAYPPILWNYSARGKAATRWRRVTNWVLAVGFGLLGACGAAGSLYDIAKESRAHSSSHGGSG